MAAASLPFGPVAATRAAGISSSSSMALGSPVGANEVAHDQSGAGRVLADEGADQGGARLIVARGLDHLERDLHVMVGAGAVGERGGDLAGDPRAAVAPVFGAVGEHLRALPQQGLAE